MNDSHFKVGDEVAIRSWDDMAQEYGVDKTTGSIKCFCKFTGPMKVFCGDQFVIDEKLPSKTRPGRYIYHLIYNDNGDVLPFSFSSDMFKRPDKYKTVDPASLFDILGVR